MKRDDQLAFSAVAVTVCGLLAVVLAVVLAAHLVVIAIAKMGFE